MPQINPRRGQLWYADLDPSRGAELQKSRPAIVLSAPTAGRLPLRLIVPLTGWNASYDPHFWIIRIEATAGNGLAKTSAADTFQIRSVDLSRFGAAPIGVLDPAVLAIVAEAVTVTIGYEPDSGR